MWWDSGTAGESATYQTAARLNDNFLSELKSESTAGSVGSDQRAISAMQPTAASVIYGVGSTIGRYDSRRVPMLAVDWRYAPARHFRLWQDLTDAIFRSRSKDSQEIYRQKLLVPFGKVDDDLKRVLRKWDVPDQTEVFFTPPPAAAAAGPGSRVWAGRHDATVGFSLRIDNSRIAVSTAGHLVPNSPFPIDTRQPRWLSLGPDAVDRLGTVVFSNDPTGGNPGVDVAVIELKRQPAPEPSRDAVLADAPLVPELSEVVIRGGRSGKRQGWILGQMLSVRQLKNRIWRNCWTICENGAGLVQRGDSGGPAILADSDIVLGHVVGAMGVERGGGRRQVGLVQDMRTIVDELEAKYERPVAVIQP